MADGTGKIIERRMLDNGMELVLYDRSRVIAGDRWQVDLLCEAYIPIAENFWEIAAGEESEHLAAIRKMLGERLVFASSKTRNFVGAAERESLLQEMVQQLYNSILKYLNRPHFPLRLFMQQYKNCRQKVLIKQAMNLAEKSAPDD